MGPSVEAASILEKQYLVDAIICDPATYSSIVDIVKIPVSPVYLDSFSIMEAIYKAQSYGRKIAFIQFHNPENEYDLEKVRKFMDCELNGFMVEDEKEFEQVLDQIQLQGHDALITTADAILKRAQAKEINSVLIELPNRSIVKALQRGIMMIEAVNRNLVFAKFQEAVLDASSDGILSIDEYENLALANLPARHLLSLKDSDLKQKVADIRKENTLLNRILKWSHHQYVWQGR